MRTDKQAGALVEMLRAMFVNSVRMGHDELTLRQYAVLLMTYLDADKHTVRGLAAKLTLSRPVISRALDRLGEFGLTRRQIDPADRRSVIVRRTRKGAERVQELLALMQQGDSSGGSAAAARPTPAGPADTSADTSAVLRV